MSESANPNVEGGMYISPEFQLGQVYMGEDVDPDTDDVILYRPTYVCVAGERARSNTNSNLLKVCIYTGLLSVCSTSLLLFSLFIYLLTLISAV